ncbi:pyrimidine dimer DNA glycosylase/endonuclease V [Dermacoccus abyssi]|uniref:pyrimidine dimer DNA glycosylase/endonuclease V n=1 Tax=Dermacoccus TaxID=57495 RepID=UPI00267858AA
MRLWSLHPSQLDRRALEAGWREALLAQKVLAGGTRGYTHRPQLQRFRRPTTRSSLSRPTCMPSPMTPAAIRSTVPACHAPPMRASA